MNVSAGFLSKILDHNKVEKKYVPFDDIRGLPLYTWHKFNSTRKFGLIYILDRNNKLCGTDSKKITHDDTNSIKNIYFKEKLKFEVKFLLGKFLNKNSHLY